MITNNHRNTSLATSKPATLGNGAESAPLRSKTGIIRTFAVRTATSKAAAAGWRDLEAFKVQEEVRIGKLAIEGAARVLGGLIAKDAVSRLSAVVSALDNEVNAAQIALTNAKNGGLASHIENRHRNFALADELHRTGKLNDEEHADFRRLIEEGAVVDIQGALLRSQRGKGCIDSLHEHALGGIQHSQAELER